VSDSQSADSEQAILWNGPAGRAWVEAQQLLDGMFQSFEDLLVGSVAAVSARRVLDVGCGTGSTTLAVARQGAGDRSCVGIDISEPMISLARARAEGQDTPPAFILANAQTYAFEPAAFDIIISRFGVMFFDDSVQAFASLRHAARRDAELRFIAWRSAAENPFMTTAERAAASLLPNLPARKPDGPGQFAFADHRRIHRMLEASGWVEIDIRPIDVACTLPETQLVPYFTRLGPVGALLQQAGDRTRTQVVEAVRAAFDPYVFGDEVRFTAACWMVSARSRSEPTARKEIASA